MTQDFYVALAAWGSWAAVACAIFAVLWQVRTTKQLTSLQLFLQLRGEYESANMQARRAKKTVGKKESASTKGKKAPAKKGKSKTLSTAETEAAKAE